MVQGDKLYQSHISSMGDKSSNWCYQKGFCLNNETLDSLKNRTRENWKDCKTTESVLSIKELLKYNSFLIK